MQAKRFVSLILCICMALTLLPATASAAVGENPARTDQLPFGDLPETDGLYPFVRYLARQGIMDGFPDGTFRPAQVLTRAEAAKATVLAKNLTLVSGGDPTFRDVPVEHWAYSYIETAAKAGLFAGYPDGTFGPEEPITRAEAVTLLLRLSGGALSDESRPIADVESGHWAYRQAATAVEAGLMTLSPGRIFSPDAPFSRGEFARSLSVLFALGPALRGAELTGKLTVTNGEVTVAEESGLSRSVSTELMVGAGMTITTDDQGQAEISFDDGSGIRMEPNTEISIVRADGLRYMRVDGTPAVAIDKLAIKLNRGGILGALANRNEGSETSGDQPVLTEAPPAWWLYPSSRRERVTIEMPSGVVGVWGTFWQSFVGASGQDSTAVLIGNAEVTSDGQAVSLVGGLSTTILSPLLPPSPPSPLTPAQSQHFISATAWIMGRAQTIQNSAPQPPSNGQHQDPGTAVQQDQLPRVVDALQGALDEVNRQSHTDEEDDDSDSDDGSYYVPTYPY